MNGLHPKIQAAGVVGIAISVLVVGAGLADQLPTNHWAVVAGGICAALLPIVRGYLKVDPTAVPPGEPTVPSDPPPPAGSDGNDALVPQP